jgi:hypothetical protein
MVSDLATVSAFCRRLTIARIFLSTTLVVGNRRSQYHFASSRRPIFSRSLPMANQPLTHGASLCGQSGRTYTIREVLTERRNPLLFVYRARYDPNPIISSGDAPRIIRLLKRRRAKLHRQNYNTGPIRISTSFTETPNLVS